VDEQIVLISQGTKENNKKKNETKEFNGNPQENENENEKKERERERERKEYMDKEWREKNFESK
jgi:hypothetical protein